MPGFNIPVERGCVQLFGDSRPTPGISNAVDTNRKCRFMFTISKTIADSAPDQRIFQAACEYIDRPTLKISKELVWQGADYINVPMRGSYDPITVVFYEVIDNDTIIQEQFPWFRNVTTKVVQSWWSRYVYDFKRSRNLPASKRDLEVNISMLDGLGRKLWSYYLLRCWPESVIPDTFSAGEADISRVKLLLSFDKVYEKPITI